MGIWSLAAVCMAAVVLPTVANAGESGSYRLVFSGKENCFIMKQRVLSVSSDRVAVVVNPGQPTGNLTNRSGLTERSNEAKRDIMQGDSACEANDLASARDDYQRAIDALTSRN